jgi:hypothetical protein
VQQRIGELTAALEVEPPGQLLRSQAISSLARDDVVAARAYGERLHARGVMDHDDVLLIEAEYVLGIASFWKGEFERARRHFERVVADYRPARRSTHLLRFSLDQQVLCLSRLANALWFLGDSDGATRARDRALALADEVEHPPSRGVALVFACALSLELDEIDAFHDQLTALEAGNLAYDMRPNRLAARVYRGYLRVREGGVEPGVAAITAALEDLSAGGYAPGQRGLVARVLLAAYEVARDPRRRLATAERLLAIGGAAGLWESEAHRARAESLAALGASPEEVQAAFDRAATVARLQGALALERRVETALRRYTDGPRERPAPKATA